MSSLDIPLSEVQLSKKKKKKKEKGVAAGPNAANDLDMPPLPDVKKKKGAAGAQPRTAAALSSEAKLDLPLDALQKAGKKRTASAANLDKSLDEIPKKAPKKKTKGKSDKDKEREYAVKAAKRERVIELIKAAVSEAVSAAEEPSVKVAIEAASAEAKKALAEDMTGTHKPFGKEELENLARDAYKLAIKGKKEEL